ncbi:MAG: o-succinylbenzoate synthase [Bacteroidia bacterium]
MLKASFKKYQLNFKTPSGTSRGVLSFKESWFIFVYNIYEPNIIGIGECGLLKGLSYDDVENYEDILQEACDNINSISLEELSTYPSIRFGVEMALLDLKNKGSKQLFDTAFTQGNASIKINGLIWMGSKEQMFEQIESKILQGFRCVKLKIGAIDFEKEISLLKYIRTHFNKDDIELRVDANGAFSVDDALNKLQRLSEFDLHSIEQPIKAKQWKAMAELCQTTPLPIALDEELIGVNELSEKVKLLDTIQPQYIILKPSLVGGFAATQEWITLAKQKNIPWWITSALESNIGLSAIAQFTSTLNTNMYQGLGTGQLYTNNFDCPLELQGENLWYSSTKAWDLHLLNE